MSAPQTGMSTGRALLLGGGAAAAAGLVLASPVLLGFSVVPPCPFRSLTGFDCPFCGGTRATRELFTGDIAGAADYNLLVPLLFLAAVGIGLWWLLSRWGGAVSFDSARVVATRRTVWIGLGIGLAAFWVLRNLPVFTYLNSGGFST